MRKKLLRWAPWNYRFWREIARWCYERSLHNPPVVPARITSRPALNCTATCCDSPGNPGWRSPVACRESRNHGTAAHALRIRSQGVGHVALRGYGYNYPANQALIPSLRSFLSRHRDVVSAAVSLFPPGKVLRPPRSVQRGLAISPPSVRDESGGWTQLLRTADRWETYYLQEGEGVLWDDTFLHSAVNRSDQPRVVLLFDVFRRDQPFWLVAMSLLFLAIAQLWQRLQNMRERALLRATAS